MKINKMGTTINGDEGNNDLSVDVSPMQNMPFIFHLHLFLSETYLEATLFDNEIPYAFELCV